MVVVAMSGGVDSSVAAALLNQQGYDVVGVTLNVWPEKSLVEADTRHNACCSLDSVEDARRVADLLGIPHYTLNFRDVFDRTVIEDFAREYLRGRTPNPCVRCNRFVKFDALLAKSRALGAEYLATGHYARVARSDEGRYVLRRAVDASKDQSYALYSLTQEQLAHTLFPLGEMEKTETRRIAARLGLITARKPDSQEICFVPDNDYARFLRQRIPSAARPGPILDQRGEVLGTHPGIAFFTVGQRKGLGLASSTPLYVLEIIPERNAVVVGERDALYSAGLIAGDVNWVSMEEPSGPVRVDARIRYRAPEVPAMARVQGDGSLLVEFDEPQRAVSPGQAVVLYQGDRVVAGGTIERAVSGQPSAVN
ncbi:MAG: tRNA 2-thiouridine(34) synthase MnmA [Sphingomonadaceae bacterium]